MENSATRPASQPDPEALGAGATTLSSIFALLVGAVVGVITTFTHGLGSPWGAIAGLAIIAALVAGFRLVFGSRIVAAAAAVGVLGAAAALALPGAGGVALSLNEPVGWLWAIGPAVVSAAILLAPSMGRGRP